MTFRADQYSVASCAPEQGGMCTDNRPGHGLHAVQLRLAAATPTRWLDALIVGVGADGWVEVATLDGGSVSLWNHGDLAEVVAPGDPVALHAVYNVLAAGSRRFNVLSAA